MYSAWLARSAFKDAPFIMMNADVFFDSSVIKALIEFPHENAIVTDVGRYLEESMKVVERDGRLVHISKTVSPEDALGSSIDVYKFSPEGGAAFFEKCSGYIEEKHQLKLWSEVALNDVLEDGLVPFFPCPLDGRWFEIDNHEDLAFANELFSVN